MIDTLMKLLKAYSDRLPPFFWLFLIGFFLVWSLFIAMYDLRKIEKSSTFSKVLLVFLFVSSCVYLLAFAYYEYNYTSLQIDPQLRILIDNYDKFNEQENKKVNIKRDSSWTIIQNIARKDRKGKEALFDVGVLTKEFYWELEKTEIGKTNGSLASNSLSNLLRSKNLLKKMRQSRGIICIGNASYENGFRIVSDGQNHLDTIVEERRAEERAKVLSSTISQILDTVIPVYKVVLGRNRIENPDESNNQRSIIILIITAREKDVDIDEVSYLALISLYGLPFRIGDFSRGTPDKFKLIPDYYTQ